MDELIFIFLAKQEFFQNFTQPTNSFL